MSTIRPTPSGNDPPMAADEPLAPAEIQRLRQILETSRGQLLAEIDHLEHGAYQHDQAGEGFRLAVGRTPDVTAEHMWEVMTTHKSIAEKQLTLMEIEQALKRIQTEQYGLCVHDQAAISRAVLDVVPWMRLCSDCAGDRPKAPAPPMDQAD